MNALLSKLENRLGPRRLIAADPLETVYIDWADDSLFLSHIKFGAESVQTGKPDVPQVVAQWQLRYGSPLLEADTEALGRWLQEQWLEQQIPKLAVVVCAPRRHVAFKSFTIPEVEGVGLAETVLLQAESRYPIAMDRVALDFVTQPCPVQEGRHLALTACISQDVMDKIRGAIRLATLELLGVGVGELTLGVLNKQVAANLAASKGAATSSHLAILANPAKLEFTVDCNGIPVMSHAIGTADQEAELLSTAEKMLDHLGTRLDELGLSFPVVATLHGPLASSIESVVAQRVDVAVQAPAIPAIRAISLAVARRHQGATIDFLNPTQPVDANAVRRVRMTWVGAVVGAVLAAALLLLMMLHWRLDRKLARLNRTHKTLEAQIDDGGEVLRSAQAITQWDDSRIVWSAELERLFGQLGDNERCYLQRLQLEAGNENTFPTARLEGVARENADALAIADRLVNDSHAYEVQPGPIQPNRRDPHYQANFDFRVEWDAKSVKEASHAE